MENESQNQRLEESGDPSASAALVLRINLRSSTPVYRQIEDGLRALLVGGAFQPGDKLPPVRQMAVDLGVNHNTVAEAYRLLAEQGWLELKRHRGATVVSRAPRRPGPDRVEDFARGLREVSASALADGLDPETVAAQLNLLATQISRSKQG